VSKDSQEIHQKHAEQKARRDKERARAGYKGRSQKLWHSETEKNSLSNPLTQKFIAQFRLHRAKHISKAKKTQYKPQKQI